MEILPNELVLYIFRFLEFESLYFMVMVSKFYHDLIYNNIRYICNNSFIKLQRDFFNENLYFNRFYFTLNELNTSFKLVFIRKDYLEDPRYDKYYEMEACKRGYQFYSYFKYLKDNKMLSHHCYRCCQSLDNIQMKRLIRVKKAGFLETHALKIAEKFNDEQIDEAIDMRQNSTAYEYMIIDIIEKRYNNDDELILNVQ